MTLNWQDLDVLVHVENTRLFQMIKDPNRKDGFEGIQKLAQYPTLPQIVFELSFCRPELIITLTFVVLPGIN